MSTQILLRGRNGISLRNVLRRRPELKRTCTRCFSTTPQEETEESDITSKVLFNSTIPFKYSPKTFAKHRRDKSAHYKIKVETPVIPVSLKYYLSDPTDQEAVKNDEVPEQTQTIYPYALARQNVAVSEENETVDHRESPCEDNPREGNLARSSRKWMNDYERYCGPIEEKEEEDEEDSEFWQQDYGTSDSSVPVSSVPCGGCGALLHCQDQSIPGFLPSEIFKECRVSDLRSLVCQRCYFLNKYNTALSVIVDEESYPKMISKIREERALVILMVDLTDFPCSVWPDIFDLIGKKKPVIIVGNKIDLLWGDKKGWSQRLEKTLQHFIPANVNVMGLRLISAKTGYGVEELITLLHKVWSHKGDVYLIGCTNVGKSTLFNVLLQSDYCKVKARDLVQRATTSPWPGTTLNLLKFPILRPEGWRLFLRTNRLKSDRARASAERALFKEQMARSKGKNLAPLQLIGRVGQTVEPCREVNEEIFDAASTHEIDKTAAPQSGINPTDPQYKMSRWLYDTPGVIHRDQILDLLTAEELIKVIPRKPTVPRTFLIKPGWTVFIAGLSRLDYIEGTSPSRWTIFSSDRLPITVCHTADAQDVYQKFAGTERMSVPIGGESRMKDWPQLKSSSDYIKFCGVGLDESCGDVVLSSTGWIAVSLNKKEIGVFRAWTPDARGIHSRCPAFLPFAVRQRGEKLAHSPAYGKSRPFLLAY